MNYAEKLAYWYLRLNGFFPLANFVLHNEGERRGSDSDVLAIRMPHTDERIGGVSVVHDALLEKLNCDFRTSQIGLICEVIDLVLNQQRLKR
ncbi:hypothetical protein [Deinococcus arenicola]|uniref:Polymerase nucleotidyl transferase domain-containing protein n=1 Tax=Deinococcus arenicola TaxID=2994950 RepID=A0ABU4DVF6_9DEIO|nr:hypothetical protein [Deinococcus sp. ZS9-10]MDV6376422.1 hypothetical protein [Deinococcus sp. ZS9-10]